MVAMKNNFWSVKEGDGHDRAHVPATPMWIAIIRVAQLALALLVLILTAVAANKFGVAWSSLALTWFTFAWTILHIGWLAISILVVPLIYNLWGQLAVEILSVIFWLASWACLASDAAAIGEYERVYIGRAANTGAFGVGSACIKASAAMGAIEWVLFVVTLVFFVISLVRHKKADAPAAQANDPEAQGASELKTQPSPTQQAYAAPHPDQQQHADHIGQPQGGFVQQPVSNPGGAYHEQPQLQQQGQAQQNQYS